ncbi:hypothetical protein LR68_02249 [Anoxybacillus sp. BCO1]|nr:hypothetical protein LR68_02249 [Anoxybacillus sp. BCO1]
MKRYDQPKKWIDEIIEVFQELGGKAYLSDIYEKVEVRSEMNLHGDWKSTVRDTIYKNPDIFTPVRVKGEGYWRLKCLENN